jgi:hypothetical protein
MQCWRGTKCNSKLSFSEDFQQTPWKQYAISTKHIIENLYQTSSDPYTQNYTSYVEFCCRYVISSRVVWFTQQLQTKRMSYQIARVKLQHRTQGTQKTNCSEIETLNRSRIHARNSNQSWSWNRRIRMKRKGNSAIRRSKNRDQNWIANPKNWGKWWWRERSCDETKSQNWIDRNRN